MGFIIFVLLRFEGVEEREEFLPHGKEGGKKVVQFTDVSETLSAIKLNGLNNW